MKNVHRGREKYRKGEVSFPSLHDYYQVVFLREWCAGSRKLIVLPEVNSVERSNAAVHAVHAGHAPIRFGVPQQLPIIFSVLHQLPIRVSSYQSDSVPPIGQCPTNHIDPPSGY